MPALFVLLWSTGFLAARLGLPHVGPFTFLLLRFALVVALLAAICAIARVRLPHGRRELAHLAVAGLLVHAGYLGGTFTAVHLGLSSGAIALLVGVQPIATAALAGPLLGERVSTRQWAGLALGLLGVALVLVPRANATGIGVGSLLAGLVALASITAGTLWQKRFCSDMDLRSGSLVQFAAAALAVAAPAVLVEGLRIEWTGEFALALAWLVLVLSLGAISLLHLLIRRGEAARVASLFYLTPGVTALLAWPMFGERLAASGIVGLLLAAVGVALVNASAGGRSRDTLAGARRD
ncbi:MAG: DMT family transporter [Pseudomonadota bacterium]